eukprot:Rmarinus@m.11887
MVASLVLKFIEHAWKPARMPHSYKVYRVAFLLKSLCFIQALLALGFIALGLFLRLTGSESKALWHLYDGVVVLFLVWFGIKGAREYDRDYLLMYEIVSYVLLVLSVTVSLVIAMMAPLLRQYIDQETDVWKSIIDLVGSDTTVLLSLCIQLDVNLLCSCFLAIWLRTLLSANVTLFPYEDFYVLATTVSGRQTMKDLRRLTTSAEAVDLEGGGIFKTPLSEADATIATAMNTGSTASSAVTTTSNSSACSRCSRRGSLFSMFSPQTQDCSCGSKSSHTPSPLVVLTEGDEVNGVNETPLLAQRIDTIPSKSPAQSDGPIERRLNRSKKVSPFTQGTPEGTAPRDITLAVPSDSKPPRSKHHKSKKRPKTAPTEAPIPTIYPLDIPESKEMEMSTPALCESVAMPHKTGGGRRHKSPKLRRRSKEDKVLSPTLLGRGVDPLNKEDQGDGRKKKEHGRSHKEGRSHRREGDRSRERGRDREKGRDREERGLERKEKDGSRERKRDRHRDRENDNEGDERGRRRDRNRSKDRDGRRDRHRDKDIKKEAS